MKKQKNPQIKITRLKKSDTKAAAALYASIISNTKYYSRLARAENIKSYSPRELRKKLADKENILLLAKVDGQLAGFLFGFFDYDVFWLDWFGTARRFRQQGIAQALLSFLERELVKQRCHKISCDTRTSNIESIKFFRKNGFKKEGHLKRHWHKQDFFLWYKFLDSRK